MDLVKEHFAGKEFLTTPMRKEVERCRLAFETAAEGKQVAMICSGDAGVYGMAGLMYELSEEWPDIEIKVIPGVTAATGGAAVLGAPLIHDFALISLSDLLTPWEKIEKRLLLWHIITVWCRITAPGLNMYWHRKRILSSVFITREAIRERIIWKKRVI